MFYEIKYKNSVGEEVHFKAEKKGNLFVAPDKPSIPSSGNPYRLMMFEGLGEVAAEMHLSKSFAQDGSTHSSTVLSERHPYLQFVLVGKDWEDLSRIRRQATRVFNPKSKGILEFSYGANAYVLKVIPESLPVYSQEDTSGKTQVASVSLVAPNPYWQNKAESKADISTETGNIEFPLEIPAEGLELSIRTISFITNIYNQGDVDTPIKVTLRAVGTVINPIIENLDTGEFIRVKRELAEGDTLEINTAFGNKRVEVIKPDGSRENVFHYIDYKSTFFQLAGGDNTIKYDAEVGENNLDVSIYYTPNYLGI